jgi:hypothetical protein
VDKWQTVDVHVMLDKGMNTVRLSNPSAWAPNIDRMTLRRAL